MKSKSVCVISVAVGLALGAFARSGAQTLAGTARDARFETRAQLELAAQNATSGHHDVEAALLQARLREGDFQEGDRIVLSIDVPRLSPAENPALMALGGVDTAVVRAGNTLQFTKVPKIPDLSLDGVLRSELAVTITAHLSRYVRNPSVRATPLLRVAVLGAVGRPGWYLTPSDAVLADVIMQAGGVTAASDVSNTVVRRAGTTLWSTDNVRSAFANSLSLDRLDLRAGDEIFIGPKRQWSITNSIQVIAGVVAIYGVLLTSRSLHK
jgi:protein involved in polysaccharide export with SLBB domain